ncbi:MAG: ABC transporter ATP-binding protein [Spirochaetales bacterium]|nr:ABC transporter ATP-binding protein [Spirochaetales bacterium]
MGVILNGITKSFEDFNINVDLNIENGELITLLGPSGCGKTTSIQIISGIINPEKGNILINGKDVTNTPIWLRNIGIVFQDYALFSHMNVYDNIAYGLKARKLKKTYIKNIVSEMLELVHLRGYENRNIESLSGGEKQRTALARALAPSPELLLLDEPLSALDARLRTILRREIRNIQQKLGITTIYVTHDQDEALSISDRIVLMNNGRIEQTGTPWDIYNKPTSKFSADFLGDSNKIPCKVEKISTKQGIYLSSTGSSLSFNIPFREGITEGKKYLLFFRPQDTKIIDKKIDILKENMLTGKILSSEYFGRYRAIKLSCNSIIINTEISDRGNTFSEVFKDDSQITVAIDSGKCWLIDNKFPT